MSTGGKDITSLSLAQPVTSIPAPKYAAPSDIEHETKVTVLENGLRVASENKFGQFCTVGGRCYHKSPTCKIEHLLSIHLTILMFYFINEIIDSYIDMQAITI